MSEHLIVVAIDFGTTYSGYAFQFRHEYKDEDPTTICAPQSWSDGKGRVYSMKTPTCLLLDNDGNIDSFGFEAERKYSEICEDQEEKNWFYFRRFKMRLHNAQDISLRTMIKSENKREHRELPALDIFSKSIQCLKQKLIEDLNRKADVLKPEDIFYVLTVPAIWNDNAKTFMRQAAIKAGIQSSQLAVSLEPECASLYSQYLPLTRFSSKDGAVQCSITRPGTVYMIVDLGGGTADITVHEKLEGGRLREVHQATGGPWGGAMVDANFIAMLGKIVDPLVFLEFMNNHSGDYLDMMRDFETLKRKVCMDLDMPLTLKIPVTLNEVCRNLRKQSFRECCEASSEAGHVTSKMDKLKISPNRAKQMFQDVADKLVPSLDECIKTVGSRKSDTSKISLILMVGGFSESKYMQEVVQQRYDGRDGLRVLIPEEAGLSVLKGAVIFGRKPESITSRVLRYTYGAEVTPPFDPKIHDESKRTKDGKRCNNVFKPFMDRGKEMQQGEKLDTIYHTTAPNQKTIKLKIFAAEKEVKYTTDDGCTFVGTMTMTLNTPRAELQDLKVTYIFGGTEIKVIGEEVLTQYQCETVIAMNE